MNLRFIEAQKQRQEELKRLQDIKAEQLKQAIDAAKKLADIQHDLHRQWMVSTPRSEPEVYEAVFENTISSHHIHPLSGNVIRGRTEEYNHLDVQWTNTLPPVPRQASSRDIERFRNTVLGINPASEVSLPGAIRENVLGSPLNSEYRGAPTQFGSSTINNRNEFLRYHNNLITNFIDTSIRAQTNTRNNTRNVSMILWNIEREMINLSNQNILERYRVTSNGVGSIIISWVYQCDPVEFMEQRVLI